MGRMAGPGNGMGAGCACADVQTDANVDLRDLALYQQQFTGPR